MNDWADADACAPVWIRTSPKSRRKRGSKNVRTSAGSGAPAPGAGKDSGLAWADGSLWVGQYRDRQIVQVDPDTGAVQRVIQTNRFVTGVTWVDGELWHGYSDDGDGGIARIDPANGNVLDSLEMKGISVSGIESDGAGRFFCGGGESGKVHIVRRA